MTEEQDGGMSREEAIAMLKAGKVSEWNEYRLAHPDWRAELSGAELVGADLSDAELVGADLSDADLTDAELTGARIIGADLTDANLRGADLTDADLTDAYLGGADLTDADLSDAYLNNAYLGGADLTDADLTDADLTDAILADANLGGATIGYTSFCNNDLSEVKGLDTAEHNGPSYVDTHTLLKSQGKIPPEFLLGCGMPAGWVDYYPSLLDMLDPIQFYSCFISHSSKDQDFADKLHAALTDRGIRVWYAPEDMRGGKKLGDQVVDAIHAFDKLMLVLTENSVDAPWVQREIRWALDKEKRDNRPVLFPIRVAPFERLEQWRLQPDTSVDFDQVLNYFIPDFRGWEDDAVFSPMVDKLIDALKADEKQKPEKSK